MTQGTYLFKDIEDGEICLFLFKKLNKQQMDVALPNCKDDGQNGDYFVGIFRKGIDYLGKTEFKGVEKIMQEQTLYDIAILGYNDVNIDGLTVEEYNKYKDFADKHMKTLEQIRNMVG